jgi:hypothetical protein
VVGQQIGKGQGEVADGQMENGKVASGQIRKGGGGGWPACKRGGVDALLFQGEVEDGCCQRGS